MVRYRILYLKESQRRHFRDAPPAPGPLKLKKKDYEPGGEIEAPGPYAAWQQTHGQAGGDAGPRPIEVGDALETETGALYVCRYVGFEEAQWFVPEQPAPPAASPEEAPAPAQ